MLTVCQTVDGTPPEVETVHQLRTGTRRVEATLETLAREAGARGLGIQAEKARQRWLRQLKKVRQASGVVRDLDVHRELLAEHYLPEKQPVTDITAGDATFTELANVSVTAMAEPDPAASLVVQARSLDAWLAARRTAAADALRKALTGRSDKLIAAEKAFTAALAQRRSAIQRKHRPAARLALEDYLRLMDAMPHLDAENLHDFRKGAKKARYVAEAGGDDPAATAMTKAIKRVQDAIGDWHDWEVLAAESREALGNTGLLLEKDLDHGVKRAYDRALRTATTMGRRFVGEWQALRPRRSASPSRPRATIQKRQ